MDTTEELELREVKALALRANRAERRLIESTLDFLDRYVDPADAFLGPNGEMWEPLTGVEDSESATGAVYRSEADLRKLRDWGRWAWQHNEFAINGHENRISYIVGEGHIYQAAPRKNRTASAALLLQVQDVIDEFIERTEWNARQQETLLRYDRDGEVFLRLFTLEGGLVSVRFVEPGQVAQPHDDIIQSFGVDPENVHYGVVSEPGDAEQTIGFFVRLAKEAITRDDWELVSADRMQQRKQAADSGCSRGVPLFYPCRKNLIRAAKVLRNMSSVAEIQAAIAMIRKHASASKAAVQTLVNDLKTATVTSERSGAQTVFQHFKPGTIIDAGKNTEYEFPANTIDPTKFIASIQADLRAVASRLVMPEFMLTSDASNANYSSTLVAEGPAVKKFKREQWFVIRKDLWVFRRVIQAAVDAGRLPANTLELVDVQAEPPMVETRDRLKEAQADQILNTLGWLSPQTGSARHNLDYEQEQVNFDEHMDRTGLMRPGQAEQDAATQTGDEGEEDDAEEPGATDNG